jgi:hypothetical protein
LLGELISLVPCSKIAIGLVVDPRIFFALKDGGHCGRWIKTS